MPRKTARLRSLRRLLRRTVLDTHLLAFLPAMLLGGFWYGGEGVLMIVAVVFPVMMMLGGVFEDGRDDPDVDALTGLATRDCLIDELDDAFAHFDGKGQSAIALTLEIDDFRELSDQTGASGIEEVLRQVADRLTGVMRNDDLVVRLDGHRFGVGIAPVRNSGLDVGLRVAERIQAAVADPISLNATNIYVTVSIGFCLARRAPEHNGEAMLRAAEIAMDEARRTGRNSVRAYSVEMGTKVNTRHALSEELARAFDEGQIRPWFQPQISTDTGEITGFEALCRWQHPERGVIPPADFLDATENAGMMERLGEVILFHSLSALRSWDRDGYGVPTIGINFSTAELRNPKLVDKIKWELDRFDLTADRLTIEVLETVVADTDNDTITANIAALATLGCSIDLDDFGTEHASIANIRRFAINRIKIDRSFVTHVDEDRQQQRTVSAILSMAEQLELETVAEGVETIGEHAMLAQLGCGHVQGFGIARPMPYDDTMSWIEKHRAKLGNTPTIGRKAIS